ncbi:MAG: EAL domain-containing protein [Caulobacterales bacterium]|nr:EAL domain-containing protein [Caulobacterales bacterium]
MNEPAGAQLAARLGLALERGELELRFQPIVDLRTLRPAGFEALLRWPGSDVEPEAVAALLDSSELAFEVGRWVREAALEAAPVLCGPGGFVSVNVTAAELHRRDLPAQIVDQIQMHAAAPGCLKLELTERRALDDVAAVAEVMGAVKAAGVGVALDDFGAGATSLAWLEALPIDTLKLDRQFVQAAPLRPRARAILAAMVELARELGMGVVAEGIETEDEADCARACGCQFGQGRRFAGALSFAEATHFGRAVAAGDQA